MIIKFPDEDLNKDMVFKFHEAIENVHFQQPSNARFCFVTLKVIIFVTTQINCLAYAIVCFSNDHIITIVCVLSVLLTADNIYYR